jgi:predicted 3-demethylubiquinone-9 3-methyltransferase (glyoxalase superfamily)
MGKTTIVVNQGKEFVIKTRYTWAKKTRTQKEIDFFWVRVFVGKKNPNRIIWIQMEFSETYQYPRPILRVVSCHK